MSLAPSAENGYRLFLEGIWCELLHSAPAQFRNGWTGTLNIRPFLPLTHPREDQVTSLFPRAHNTPRSAHPKNPLLSLSRFIPHGRAHANRNLQNKKEQHRCRRKLPDTKMASEQTRHRLAKNNPQRLKPITYGKEKADCLQSEAGEVPPAC